MTSQERDAISLKFCACLAANLPVPTDKSTSVASKTHRQIDSEPAAMLQFAAEVAEITFHVFPLSHPEFPKSVVRKCADAIKQELGLDTKSMLTEDRLLLYWAGIVRLMSSFKTRKADLNLSEAQLLAIAKKYDTLKYGAAGYGLCTDKKVKEIINGR